MNIHNFIEVNPKIMMGKPVIKGTRITVEVILEKMGSGETIEDILVSYPSLTEEKVRAALLFASESLKGESIYPVSM